MVKWIALPLVAALAMTTSGFLNALERMTEESVLLARSSKDAPRSSLEAAEEVSDLPLLAELTGRQATAFKELADALAVSGRRVRFFAGSIREQVQGVSDVATAIDGMRSEISCVEEKLSALVAAGESGPPILTDMQAILRSAVGTQERSIRRLKSINRKLTALGVVATATGVQAPPPPGDAPAPKPGRAPDPSSC
jgi:hypothetical protein